MAADVFACGLLSVLSFIVDCPVNDRLVLLSSLAKPELTPSVLFKVRWRNHPFLLQ